MQFGACCLQFKNCGLCSLTEIFVQFLTFSLHVLNSDSLFGYWSGYDSDNNVINFGEYIFKKVLKVRIHRAGEDDWSRIVRICDETLGKDYIENLKADHLEVLVAKMQNGGVVGFVAFKSFSEKCPSTEFPFINNDKIPASFKYCSSKGLVGIIKTLAVDPKYQGRGVGTKLFDSAHEECIDSNTTAIIVPAWKQNNVINIKNILRNKGYEFLTELSDYWKNDCDKNLFKCPSRKPNGQCVCSLVIYWKLI